MATGVSLRQILLPQLNWPTLITPCLVQESRTYLLYKPSYSQFSVKISNALTCVRAIILDPLFAVFEGVQLTNETI